VKAVLRMNTMKEVIFKHISPHLGYYFPLVHTQKTGLHIQGIEAFGKPDRFVGGKVVNAFAFLLCEDETMAARYPEGLAMLKDIIDFTADFEHMETWGYLNYVIGLNRLRKAGLLGKVLSPETEAKLKAKLDWRHFVDTTTWKLIYKPTNYYGVAFGIARYRHLLGWETAEDAATLFTKLMEHVKEYSGECNFMDETAGEGRFDRYSVLIPAETAELLSGTGLPVDEQIKSMLRKSSEICLALANDRGDGFAYGRSLSAYGDTAIMQVLAAAAGAGVLSKSEMDCAYSYSFYAMQKFVNFWIDHETISVNMWDKGRRTDAYRNKGRILGENMSLSMQLVDTYEAWAKLGYEHTPVTRNICNNTKTGTHADYFAFALGTYKRGLAIVHDGKHSFSLPLINGGGGTSGGAQITKYYYANAYLPAPFEIGTLEVAADSWHPNLVPRLTLSNGSQIMPIANFTNIEQGMQGSEYKISYTIDAQCIVGDATPARHAEISSKTSYSFGQGKIRRDDVFTAATVMDCLVCELELGCFGKNPVINDHTVSFAEGPLASFTVHGLSILGAYAIDPANEQYHTPHGALATRIACRKALDPQAHEIRISWELCYR